MPSLYWPILISTVAGYLLLTGREASAMDLVGFAHGLHHSDGASDAPVSRSRKDSKVMLNIIWVVALVLAGLWVVGLATSYTMGGLIHVLLILAIIAVIVRVFVGRRGG